MSERQDIRFKAAEDGSFSASVSGFSCVIAPSGPEGNYKVEVEGIEVVRETDDLEHAIRSCVSFAKQAAMGL